ncbi:MAG: TlpA family protein disulfide reductase [Desulfobaccales bacterium]
MAAAYLAPPGVALGGNEAMRRLLLFIFICLSLWISSQAKVAWAELREGQRFSSLTFSGTISDADRLYLGLARPGEFTVMNIQARYLLVDIFSDACPHCTAQAPVVNRLFQMLSANPKLNDGTLKMVGVGYYGTPATMERWRGKYGARFPLLPDPGGKVFKTLEIYGTPTYVVLDSRGTVVYLFYGEIENPQRFMRELQAHLGL